MYDEFEKEYSPHLADVREWLNEQERLQTIHRKPISLSESQISAIAILTAKEQDDQKNELTSAGDYVSLINGKKLLRTLTSITLTIVFILHS